MKRSMILACMMTAAIAAGPATKPASQPSGEELPAGKRRLASLIKENEDLKAKVEELSAEVARLRKSIVDSVAGPAVVGVPQTGDELRDAFQQRIKLGMSLADVKTVLGEPIASERTDDAMTYLFAKSNKVAIDQRNITTHRVWCTFENGALTSCRDDRLSSLMGRVKAETR